MQVVTAGLQPVTVDQAHEQLVAALKDMLQQDDNKRRTTRFLKGMLHHRQEAAELAARYDIR